MSREDTEGMRVEGPVIVPRAPARIVPGAGRAPTPVGTTRPIGPDPLAGIKILQAEPGNSRPSVLLIGDSGTGKTWGLGMILRRLLARNETAFILGIENKWQTLARWRPFVVSVTEPIEENGRKRRPRPSEVYVRLLKVIDAIATGQFREHEGRKITLFGVDGLMELCDITARAMKEDTPRAASTGEKNSYALYDMIGEKSVDFFKMIRDAASEATRAYGAEPLGVVATCGEAYETDKFGNNGAWRPILPGRIGPRALPFQFEAILRLAVETGLDGRSEYVCYTTKGTDFFAKCPEVGLAARIGGVAGEEGAPDIGEIYERLLEHYSKTTF